MENITYFTGMCNTTLQRLRFSSDSRILYATGIDDLSKTDQTSKPIGLGEVKVAQSNG